MALGMDDRVMTSENEQALEVGIKLVNDLLVDGLSLRFQN
jgi:hypothetical protein